MLRRNRSVFSGSWCMRMVVVWILFLLSVVQGKSSKLIWYTILLCSAHGWQKEIKTTLLTSSPTISNVPISAIPSKLELAKPSHDQPSPKPNVSSRNTSKLVSESTLTPTISLSPSIHSISSKKINAQFIADSTLTPTISLSPSIHSISFKKINAQFIADSTLTPTTSLSPSFPSISSKKINANFIAESTLTPTTSHSPSTTLVTVNDDMKASSSSSSTRLVTESTLLPTTSLSPSATSILVKDASSGPTSLPASSMFPSLKQHHELFLTSKPNASPAAVHPHADSATSLAPKTRPTSASATERPHEFTLVPTTSDSPSQAYILTAESTNETPTKLNTHSLALPVSNLDTLLPKPVVTPEPTEVIRLTPRAPAKISTVLAATKPEELKPMSNKTTPLQTYKDLASQTPTKALSAYPSSGAGEETVARKPFSDEMNLLPTVKRRTVTPTKQPEMMKSTLPSMTPRKNPSTTLVPTEENPLASQNNISAPSAMLNLFHSTHPILPASTLSAPLPALPSNNSQISTVTESVGNQTTTKPSSKNHYIVVILLTANIALLLIIVAARSSIIRLRESRRFGRSMRSRDGSFPIATTTPRRSNRATLREKPSCMEEESSVTPTSYKQNDAQLMPPEIMWEEQKSEIMDTTETIASFKESGTVCMPPTLNTMVSEEFSNQSDLIASLMDNLVPDVSPQKSLETPIVSVDATIASPSLSQKSGADCSSTLGFLNTMSTTSGSLDLTSNGFGSDKIASSSESSFVRAQSIVNESYPEDEMSDSNGKILRERSVSSTPDESIEEDMFFLCSDRWYNDGEDIVHDESRNDEVSAAGTNGRGFDCSGATHRRSDAKYIGTSSRYSTPSKLELQEGVTPMIPEHESYRTESSDGVTDDNETRESLSRASTSLDQFTATSSSYTPGRSSVYTASETTSGYWSPGRSSVYAASETTSGYCSSSKYSSQSSSTDTDESSYRYRSPSFASRSGVKGRSTPYMRRRYSLSPLPPRKPYL